MPFDMRRALPAGLTTWGAAVVLGLVVALVAALTGSDLGLLYTPALVLGGVVGALTLGRGGGVARLAAHVLAPLAGGVVAALVLAALAPEVSWAWAASPVVWLAGLEGGLAVWLARTVPWRQTVRTPASEWRRVTGRGSPPPAPQVARSAAPAPQGRPAYGAYAPAPAPGPADAAGPVSSGTSTALLVAVAWGVAGAVAVGLLGTALDLPLGVLGGAVSGGITAWRVPAAPTDGIGRVVGPAAVAAAVGTVLLVVLPGSVGVLPSVALGVVAGVAVGAVRRARWRPARRQGPR